MSTKSATRTTPKSTLTNVIRSVDENILEQLWRRITNHLIQSSSFIQCIGFDRMNRIGPPTHPTPRYKPPHKHPPKPTTGDLWFSARTQWMERSLWRQDLVSTLKRLWNELRGRKGISISMLTLTFDNCAFALKEGRIVRCIWVSSSMGPRAFCHNGLPRQKEVKRESKHTRAH